MEELTLWDTRLRLHRRLEALIDEDTDGVRHTSFACEGDAVAALLLHYDASLDDAGFRGIGRALDARSFSLTAERQAILLTVSCTADVLRGPLLTFMADNATRRRSSSPLPPAVVDAWGLALSPVAGSLPDTFEEGPHDRCYRFTLPLGSPEGIARHFRAVGLEAGFDEIDFVESAGAVSLALRHRGRDLVLSAWQDPSEEGAIYAVSLRR